MKLPKTSIIFARNIISRRFPSFSLLLPNLFHCFCPNFGKKQWDIRAKAMGNSGKSNGKIWAKANEKTRKATYILGKNYLLFLPEFSIQCFFPNFPLFLPEFPIAFARIIIEFCPNFPEFIIEFPTAFSRISHCFCPNFPLLLPELLLNLPEFSRIYY